MEKLCIITLLTSILVGCNQVDKKSGTMADEIKPTDNSPTPKDTTPKVTGIGGVFFFSDDPEKTKEWYAGDKNLEFTLRVMVSDKIRKLKKGRIYQVAEFHDLYNKSLLCRIDDYGWTKIDLEEKEIIIPGRYKAFFLIFDLVKPKNMKKEQAMVIPFQRGSNENQYAGFYFPGGAVGILDTKNEHFAVVLNYLSE